MKKFFDYMNSVQSMIGLLFVAAFGFVLYITLLMESNYKDAPFYLHILVWGFCFILGGYLLYRAACFISKGIYYARNYTKRQRAEIGDILLCRLPVNPKDDE